MQALSEILFTIAFIILNFVYFSVNLFQDKTNSFLTPHSSLLTSSTTNYPLPTISRSCLGIPTDKHGMHRFQCPVCY